MVTVLLFLVLLAVVLHLASYGRWAWRNNLRPGAAGIFFIALVTLILPVGVWFYHRFIR
ncbi:hypothetical protein [Desulfotomaculum copahuensis]|uniref:hypothetical protein n=1 Tax=Desulfotomaculum copahuensis TaxID=1838280 RepID=UPI000AF36432|nr:hypothetical protein [Desulfotomaculum copahuensis]